MHRTRPGVALRGTDEGFALITVLGALTVVSLFLLTSLAYALNSTGPSRKDQDAKAALAAAQAGIAEFASRLSLDDTYYANNGGVHGSNPAFTQEVPVQGTNGAAANYTYRLLTDAQTTGVHGLVRLAVTGCSMPVPVLATSTDPFPCRDRGGVRRELVAEYRPDGFLRYIYFTDYESGDPSVVRGRSKVGIGDPPVYEKTEDDPTTGNPNYTIRITYRVAPATHIDICKTHYYAGRHLLRFTAGSYIEVRQRLFKGSPDGTPTETTLQASASSPMTFEARPCYEISFTGSDVVAGQAHSNDAFSIIGPVRFTDRTTTSWGPVASLPPLKPGMTALAPPTDGRLWWGDPKELTLPERLPEYGQPIPLPVSNAALKTKADPADPAAPGCLYTGQTRITFVADPDGTGPATGSMRVLSPATTSTNAPATPARCYNVATPGVEQTVSPVPPVIYVQDGTCGPTTDIGYPKTGEVTTGPASYTTKYGCGNGHAFVSGVLSGRVTVGTSRDVVITGDTKYQNGVTGTDALGLIPERSAWIYHPVTTDSSCAPTEWCHWVNLLTTPVRRVDAAILSVGNSFLVQNWYLGQPLSSETTETACLPENLDTMTGCSKLTVRGSIIQRHRGPVGEAATSTRPRSGYLKNYLYDERLLNSPPPFFLQPKDSWRVHLVTD